MINFKIGTKYRSTNDCNVIYEVIEIPDEKNIKVKWVGSCGMIKESFTNKQNQSECIENGRWDLIYQPKRSDKGTSDCVPCMLYEARRYCLNRNKKYL